MPNVILRYRNLGAGTARGRMYSAGTAGVNVRADTAQAAGSGGTSTPYDLAAARVWNLT